MKQKAKPGFVRDNNEIFLLSRLGPAQTLVIGFLIIIALGGILLFLPISSSVGAKTSFLDAIFTATSAVCVTGLVVVNTFTHWSTFGKVIIIVLVQVGGLGFMTLVSMLFILLGRKITLRDRLVMQEAMGHTTAGIVRFTRHVVKGTLIVEGVGALLLSFVFVPEYGLGKGIWYSIFHSISGFCNAGFDIIGDSNLIPYVGNVVVNFTIMGLVILGGLGFGVWVDVVKMLQLKLNNKMKYTWKQCFHRLSLHSKLVMVITFYLIIAGFIFFFLAELRNPNTLGALTYREKVLAALFQSVSPRTAGFSTIVQNQLTDASKFMTIILMFVGGSPAGTAGGIKTVTAGVLVLCAISTIKGKERTEVFGRRITVKALLRSLTIIMIALGVILAFTMILSFTEEAEFIDLLFEVVAGFSTAGFTLGITPNLSFVGKIIIIIDMFIGRLGPVTMAVAIIIRQGNHKSTIQYPEEKIIV